MNSQHPHQELDKVESDIQIEIPVCPINILMSSDTLLNLSLPYFFISKEEIVVQSILFSHGSYIL